MLPYDQIPPERRTIGDYTGRLGDEGHNGVLAVALAQWMARDDSKADVRARQLDLTRAALREHLVAGDTDNFRVVVETLAQEFDIAGLPASAACRWLASRSASVTATAVPAVA